MYLNTIMHTYMSVYGALITICIYSSSATHSMQDHDVYGIRVPTVKFIEFDIGYICSTIVQNKYFNDTGIIKEDWGAS